jgi:hypothetical protein
LFCQNYMDDKLVCQTIGVALPQITRSGLEGKYADPKFSETSEIKQMDYSWI